MDVRPQLHPMGTGELLDTAFSLYRRNIPLFAGTVAVFVLPQSALAVLISSAVNQSDPSTTWLEASWATLFIGFTLNFILAGVMARVVSARYLGELTNVRQAYLSVGWKFLRLIGGLLLQYVLGALCIIPISIVVAIGIATGIPVLAFFALVVALVGTVFLWARFFLTPIIIVLEGRHVGRSFTRSWSLVGGSWWRVLFTVLALDLLVLTVSGVVSTAVSALLLWLLGSWGWVGSVIATTVVGILLQPVKFGGITLLYYDLRIRSEGFDLQHLVHTIGELTPV